MHPFAALGDRSRQQIDEGGNVVVGDGFPLGHGDRIDRRRFPNGCCHIGGDHPELGPGLGRQGLDLLKHLESPGLGPDVPHLRKGVAIDHRVNVAFRCGPTETMETGTPASSSTRAM